MCYRISQYAIGMLFVLAVALALFVSGANLVGAIDPG